jgi:hypothetical protein
MKAKISPSVMAGIGRCDWLNGLLLAAGLWLQPLAAQETGRPPAGAWPLKLPPSLKQVPLPVHGDLLALVRDRQAAVQLGKALFWDMQVGSDERTACATCHHQAGADSRWRGSWRQGDRAVVPADADRLPALPLAAEAGDILGSPGVHARPHGSGRTKAAVPERQVTGRNSPSVINSIFNHRNFWDGRANAIFNGRSPFGRRDDEAQVYWSTNGSGVALVTPFARLVGTLALPLANSANASAGVAFVPAGAPVGFSRPGKPLPAQRTVSVAWQALFNKSKSAWQSAGQNTAVACRQLYGVVITPLVTTTECKAADCTYCTMWSNASLQYACANGRDAKLSQSKQSEVRGSSPAYASSVP